jgi:hypothetical protein
MKPSNCLKRLGKHPAWHLAQPFCDVENFLTSGNQQLDLILFDDALQRR